jgi:hypothetical protein
MEGTARALVQRLTRDARISPPSEVTKCSTAEASTCVNLASLTIRREEGQMAFQIWISRVLPTFYPLLVVTARAHVPRPTRDARISPPREETRCSIAEVSTFENPENLIIRRSKGGFIVLYNPLHFSIHMNNVLQKSKNQTNNA